MARNLASTETHDLCLLEDLTESTIFTCIRNRYKEGQFYTYVGDALLAINPCQEVDLYRPTVHRRYKNARSKSAEEPHIFWIAEKALSDIQQHRKSSCVIVGGISGAGKTESTKFLLEHILLDEGLDGSSLAQKLKQCNQVLEMFGNAKTALNDNSSRFAKLVTLRYTTEGSFLGAGIRCFTLEKSRVVHQNSSERNFHIFYQLMATLSQRQLDQYLSMDEEYRILQRNEMWQRDLPVFQDIQQIFLNIGISKQITEDLYCVLAAILLLTNIRFQKDQDDDITIMPSNNKDRSRVYDNESLKKICDLLGIRKKEIELSLKYNITTLSGERIESPKTLSAATDGRDAMAKYMYNRLFEGVVALLNSSLVRPHTDSNTQMLQLAILDISGFESLPEVNGFEQLLINITNETMHQLFLHQLFKMEQESYKTERILWKHVQYHDNADVIATLNGHKCSVLSLLEDTNQQGLDDQVFVVQLNKELQGQDVFVHRNIPNQFGIRHYAGEITYTAVNFVDLNANTLPEPLKACLLQSTNHFLRSHEKVGTVSKLHGFVSTDFKKSLSELKKILQGIPPLFVRCMSPNPTNRPGSGNINAGFLADQLRSAGIFDLVRIRKYGYPERYTFSDFFSRYGILLQDRQYHTDKDRTLAIVKQCLLQDLYQVGLTKIFLKQQAIETLEIQIQKRKPNLKTERDIPASSNTSAYQSMESIPTAYMSASSSVSDVWEPKTDYNQSTESESEDESNPGVEIEDGVANGFGTPENNKNKNDVLEPIADYNQSTESDSEDESSTSEDGVANHFGTPENKENKAYDMFRETEGDMEEEENECVERFLKISRFIIYLILFTLNLSTGVTVHIYFLSLITHFTQTNSTERLQYANSLMLVTGIPYCWTLIMSLFSVMFKRVPSMPWKFTFLVVLLECFQTAGTASLIYKVLPGFDSFRASILMLAVAIIPSALSIVDKMRRRSWKWSRRSWMTALSVVTLVMQLGGPLILFLKGLQEKPYTDILWGMVSLVCISIGWWENFLPCRLSYMLNESRHKTNLLTYLMKIAVLILCVNQLVDNHRFVFSGQTSVSVIIPLNNSMKNMALIENNTIGDFNYLLNVSFGIYNTSMNNFSKPQNDKFETEFVKFFNNNSHVIVIVLSSLVFYFSSTLACCIYMQRLAFCLPLILVSPVSMTLVYVNCSQLTFFHRLFTFDLICQTPDFETSWWILLVGGGLWISLLLLTFYIWLPYYERMASISSLFVLPGFECTLPHINLLLRRRCDETKHIQGHRGNLSVPEVVDNNQDCPKVYFCATMWHETRQEMVQLLKSLFRIDRNCAAREFLAKKCKSPDKDRYEPEFHIIVDDAFRVSSRTKQKVPNEYIMQLIECINDTARLFLPEETDWPPPKKATLPYGGRLTWILPAGTKMVVHMKDKTKVRHRKRWSQIMYMYYLLGFKTFGNKSEHDIIHKTSPKSRSIGKNMSFLELLPSEQKKKLRNTFILTLDGDVDFQPGSVRLLIDRMKKNSRVGAVCGRIHPIGSGPMVWYQKFEYAVGHWLQKAAEHVFGCVLCCPGCFSLFRTSAIMDDNVLRTYTTPPTIAKHYIQFEQGEDRWLCTLLLQQGYKIDYCAGADALTYAPETFNEFYIQRRRWSPSTIANIMDLLSSWRSTVRRNNSISSLYMFYQAIMLSTSLLAPATVTLLIAGSFSSVLGIKASMSYFISLIPVVAYILVCLKCTQDYQLRVAALLSSVYSIIMVIVTVGTILNIIEDDLLSPNILFLIGLVGIFILTALCHPKEFACLLYGLLYYVTVPSTFIFMTVYFITNINNVSWGTRENISNKATVHVKKRKQSKTLYKKFLIRIGQLFGLDVPPDLFKDDTKLNMPRETKKVKSVSLQVKETPDDTFWMRHKCFDKLEEFLEATDTDKQDEIEFWNNIIDKYLKPQDSNIHQEQTIKEELDTLRDNVVFGFFLLNLMFSIGLFQLQLNRERLQDFFLLGKYEPVSVIFLSVFLMLLMSQFIAMLIHRWGTLMHLVASTSLSQKDMADFDLAVHHTSQLINPGINAYPLEDKSEVDAPEPDHDLSDNNEDDILDEESNETHHRAAQYRQNMHRGRSNAYHAMFAHNFQTVRQNLRHSRNHHKYWHSRQSGIENSRHQHFYTNGGYV